MLDEQEPSAWDRAGEATTDEPICLCGARAYWTSTAYREFECLACGRRGMMHDGAVVAR